MSWLFTVNIDGTTMYFSSENETLKTKIFQGFFMGGGVTNSFLLNYANLQFTNTAFCWTWVFLKDTFYVFVLYLLGS